jgi:hypothetical protein
MTNQKHGIEAEADDLGAINVSLRSPELYNWVWREAEAHKTSPERIVERAIEAELRRLHLKRIEKELGLGV